MKITVFVPISRTWRINKVIDQITTLDIGDNQVDAVIILDNTFISTSAVKNAFLSRNSNIKLTTVYNTNNEGIAEMNLTKRRQRITEVFTRAQGLIPRETDLVFTFEDDTDFEPNTLIKLIAFYFHKGWDYKVGLISGVQAGRWGFRMLGLWKANDYNDPTLMETLDNSPIDDQIDAAGFYCFITSRDNFVNTPHKFDFFGPDVHFGLSLRSKGYSNFVDWTISTGHVTRTHTLYPDDECISIKYEKVNNEWERVNLT